MIRYSLPERRGVLPTLNCPGRCNLISVRSGPHSETVNGRPVASPLIFASLAAVGTPSISRLDEECEARRRVESPFK